MNKNHSSDPKGDTNHLDAKNNETEIIDDRPKGNFLIRNVTDLPKRKLC